jgi:hypothetical protein
VIGLMVSPMDGRYRRHLDRAIDILSLITHPCAMPFDSNTWEVCSKDRRRNRTLHLVDSVRS